MTALKQLEHLNEIGEDECESIAKVVFTSFLIRGEYKSSSVLEKKEELIDFFSLFLEKYLELQMINSKDKLQVIRFLDKLNIQKELLEVKKGEIKTSDIKSAAKRLGKKAQSAFTTKS